MKAVAQEIKTIKDRVEFVLKSVPESRNSDKRLTILVWEAFYGDLIHEQVDARIGEMGPRTGRKLIDLENLMDLPSQDGIKRIRAHFQNTLKLYPPTSPEVAQERGWREDDWMGAMGYSVEDRAQHKWKFAE